MSRNEYSADAPYEGGQPAIGLDFDTLPLNLEELDFEALDQLGGFGSWLKKAGKNIGKVAKKGLKASLPIAKIAGTALAFVVPPAGIGIVAAAEGADRLISMAEAGGKLAKTASQAYKATKDLASKGDPDARRALQTLKTQAAQRKIAAVPKGKPSPNMSGAQLARDASKLQRPVKIGPRKTFNTTGTTKPGVTSATPEKGFLVNLHGRVRPGKFKTA